MLCRSVRGLRRRRWSRATASCGCGGRLLSADNARALLAQHGEPAGLSGRLDAWGSWAWMGSDRPQLVNGLPGLASIYIGGAHALAVAA